VGEGGEVICPLHGYRFDVRTGACRTDPALRAKPVALVRHADGFTVTP
jgi:nitrite reductase/ring-hydroxylating ferredoxin subunit